MLSGTEVGIKGWEKERKPARDLGITGMVRGVLALLQRAAEICQEEECARGCVCTE